MERNLHMVSSSVSSKIRADLNIFVFLFSKSIFRTVHLHLVYTYGNIHFGVYSVYFEKSQERST